MTREGIEKECLDYLGMKYGLHCHEDIANKNMSGQQDISILDYEQGFGSQMPLLPPLSSVVPEASTCPAQETSSPFPKVASPRAPPAPIEHTTLSVNSNNLLQPHAHTSAKTALGPYTPTLILHGGSGSITRAKLPPALYAEYRASLLTYLQSTHETLKAGASALDTACHAVSLMEDDPLFNCGRGSVFTEKGTIEMEASVMVSSVRNEGDGTNALPGAGVPAKRGASVSLIKGTRHPVMLAREVLLAGGDGLGGVGTMHCQLSGPDVEKWGWNEKGLERKGPEWFWTRKRWKEHLRDLEKQMTEKQRTSPGQCSVSFDGANVENRAANDPYSRSDVGAFEDVDDLDYPSQGTVGAVCMDSWGNLAVATSTGGLTNKKAGRIGDTPTVGAGFWAESWEEDGTEQAGETEALSRCQFDERQLTFTQRLARALDAGFGDILQDCLQPLSPPADDSQGTLLPPDNRTEHQLLVEKDQPLCIPQMTLSGPPPSNLPMALLPRRRAVALGGTGNGDSFLRTAAVRTTAAKCRFGSRPDRPVTLAEAVTNVAGPGGHLQQSAGDRWQKTFEGQGGIIGIELFANEKEGKVVFDFNCGGMWRAWVDEQTGESRVMVFKGEYEA